MFPFDDVIMFAVHAQVAWVAVTKPISSVPLFSHFSELSNHWLLVEYHVHIWQTSDKYENNYKNLTGTFPINIEHFPYGVINERRFGNPHP